MLQGILMFTNGLQRATMILQEQRAQEFDVEERGVIEVPSLPLHSAVIGRVPAFHTH